GGTVTLHVGATSVGTATLVNGAADFAISTGLPAGSYAVFAQYNGSDTLATSTSATLTQTVDRFDVAVFLSSSPNPAAVGGTVTLTAVADSDTAVAGTLVDFVEGTTLLGSAALDGTGVAVFTTSSLALGQHSVHAEVTQTQTSEAAASPAVVQVINRTVSATA